jgi:hypothetical protein
MTGLKKCSEPYPILLSGPGWFIFMELSRYKNASIMMPSLGDTSHIRRNANDLQLDCKISHGRTGMSLVK